VTAKYPTPNEGPIACVLCGGRPRFVGVFVPDPEVRARLYGRPPALAYGLCGRCRGLRDVAARVEVGIFRMSVQ
jgi:hypothetical protein